MYIFSRSLIAGFPCSWYPLFRFGHRSSCDSSPARRPRWVASLATGGTHYEQYIRQRNSHALSFRPSDIMDLPEVREKNVSFLHCVMTRL